MNGEINVLVACEESQRVCKEFRKRGFNAYSNDVVNESGGHPEWHIKMDAKMVLNGGNMRLQTGERIDIPKWDLIIAHPPCTYLSNAATRSHSLKCTPDNWINGRTLSRIEGMSFFMQCVMANCDYIAVENPVGVMNKAYRKPDQIIEPYQFAASESDSENYVTKRTCLWLKGLPLLKTNDLEKPNNAKLFGTNKNGKAYCWEDAYTRDPKGRSKTFPGIAAAFAEQWGDYLIQENQRGVKNEI